MEHKIALIGVGRHSGGTGMVIPVPASSKFGLSCPAPSLTRWIDPSESGMTSAVYTVFPEGKILIGAHRQDDWLYTFQWRTYYNYKVPHLPDHRVNGNVITDIQKNPRFIYDADILIETTP